MSIILHSRSTIINEKKIIIRKGNNNTSSHSMEFQGFKESIDLLLKNKINVKYICCDQDGSVNSYIRENLPNIKILIDPGHRKKSFKKQLEKIFGEKYKYFTLKFSRWFMYSLLEARLIGLKIIGKRIKSTN